MFRHTGFLLFYPTAIKYLYIMIEQPQLQFLFSKRSKITSIVLEVCCYSVLLVVIVTNVSNKAIQEKAGEILALVRPSEVNKENKKTKKKI